MFWVAGAVATAVLAGACVPEVAVPVDRSVASPFQCQGITGDNASSLGDSRATAVLFATLSPGSSSVLAFPDARITPDVPASTTSTAGPLPIRFDIDWGALPTDSPLVKPLRELLRKATLEVRQGSFSVAATGAASETATAPAEQATYDLSLPIVLRHQTATALLRPTGVGTVIYSLRPIRMTIPVDASVAGVTFNTLTFDCTAAPTLPTTLVTPS